ncbi:MAG: hypothetical protein ABSG98_08275 [Anaerolineales bacterium]
MTGTYHIHLPERRTPRKSPNPIWMGIGCLLVVGLPAVGYLVAEWFLQANQVNHWVYLPPQAAWPPIAPYLVFKVVVAVIVMLFALAIFSALYSLVAPIRPGAYDAPPVTKRARRTRPWR